MSSTPPLQSTFSRIRDFVMLSVESFEDYSSTARPAPRDMSSPMASASEFGPLQSMLLLPALLVSKICLLDYCAHSDNFERLKYSTRLIPHLRLSSWSPQSVCEWYRSDATDHPRGLQITEDCTPHFDTMYNLEINKELLLRYDRLSEPQLLTHSIDIRLFVPLGNFKVTRGPLVLAYITSPQKFGAAPGKESPQYPQS